MGDGVNIAARLEGVASRVGFVCPRDAYRQVKARLELQVTDLGAAKPQEHRRAGACLSARQGAPARERSSRQAATKPRGV